MRPPSPGQLGALLEELGRALRGTEEAKTGVSGERLLDRLDTWAQIGFPPNVGFDPPAARPPIDDEHAQDQPASSVERAGRLRTSVVHTLRILDDNAWALKQYLAAVFPSTPAGVPDPEPCEGCARFGFRAPMAHYGDVGGRLERLMRLCLWCYDRVYKTDELPTFDQTRRWHERGRARERVAGPGAKARKR